MCRGVSREISGKQKSGIIVISKYILDSQWNYNNLEAFKEDAFPETGGWNLYFLNLFIDFVTLTPDEVLQYFPSNEDRQCSFTRYSIPIDDSSSIGAWWLKDLNYVTNNGEVSRMGIYEAQSAKVYYRPSMWLTLDVD